MNKKYSLVAMLLLGITSLFSQNFTVDGNIRLGYQNHKTDTTTTKQDSIGGKLHIESKVINNISAGATFYTTNKISHDKAVGVNFLDSNYDSYSILGEAYLKGKFKNTTIKLGRQELDTPFADTDDIGMIPNTFEAGLLINKDIQNTTIIFAKVQKWAGVDTDTPEKFSELNNKNHLHTLGIIYDGFKDIALQAWQYNLKDFKVDKISYFEASYKTSINDIALGLGGQYAVQNYSASGEKKATIAGVTASLGFEKVGLTLSTSYNKSSDNSAVNGFGGGPFFTSCEHLTLAEVGTDGKASRVGLELDTTILGVPNFLLELSKLTLKNSAGTKATEIDFVASYEINDKLTVDFIYSDTDDKINNDKYKNTRVFANYSF